MSPRMGAMWPDLVACAERGGHSEAELREKLEGYHAIRWPVVGGEMVLCRTEDDACLVWLGVGDGDALRAAECAVKAFARDVGCTRLRIEGRRGWKRKLPHWTCRDEDDGTVTLELPL